MRIIRRKVLKKKNEVSKIDKIRNQVEIFESDGVIYAHLLHYARTWNIYQCIILDGINSVYRGIKINDMEKHRMKLEDLEKNDLDFLIKEMEYENAK